MEKSVALISVIFLMLACSLIALVALSLLTQGTESGLGFLQSIQAYAIATGGKECYLEQLENDTDWTDEVNQTDIPLGSGTFDITINSSSNNRASFIVTGKVPGYSNQTVQRQIRLTAEKFPFPKACLFAVYWGRDTGLTSDLRNSTVNGNYWSRGTTDVQGGSSISGIAYYADTAPGTQDITGTGTFTKQAVARPYPDMPQIDQTYYNDLMSSFNSYIDTYSTGTDRIQTTNLVLNGNIIGCRNFNTTGNITISGNGYIVARQDINLHTDRLERGTLTVSPSGGNIYFLAGRDLEVRMRDRRASVLINNGAYLYSRASTSNNQQVRIDEDRGTIEINSSFIIGRVRITVEGGASLTDCTLYVSDVSDDNNYLRIGDSGTTVSGSIISVSGRDPGLIIDTGASVTGLVYHWGDTTGYTDLDSATISGSAVASQFRNDGRIGRERINNCTITYDQASLPQTPPPGFEGSVLVEPNSWDDN